MIDFADGRISGTQGAHRLSSFGPELLVETGMTLTQPAGSTSQKRPCRAGRKGRGGIGAGVRLPAFGRHFLPEPAGLFATACGCCSPLRGRHRRGGDVLRHFLIAENGLYSGRPWPSPFGPSLCDVRQRSWRCSSNPGLGISSARTPALKKKGPTP